MGVDLDAVPLWLQTKLRMPAQQNVDAGPGPVRELDEQERKELEARLAARDGYKVKP